MIIKYDDSNFSFESIAHIISKENGYIEEKQKTGTFKNCMVTVTIYYAYDHEDNLIGKFSPPFFQRIEKYLNGNGYEIKFEG